MVSDTISVPISEVINLIADDLDFTPTCAVDERPKFGSVLGAKSNPCEQPAVWIGIPPCGHEDYFCEIHHSDSRSFYCEMCGQRDMMLATYRWVRL